MRSSHINTRTQYWRNVSADALLTLCVAVPVAMLVFVMLGM